MTKGDGPVIDETDELRENDTTGSLSMTSSTGATTVMVLPLLALLLMPLLTPLFPVLASVGKAALPHAAVAGGLSTGAASMGMLGFVELVGLEAEP